MCVVGRNTFIGAGSTFTDYNLVPAPIRALDARFKNGAGVMADDLVAAFYTLLVLAIGIRLWG